MGVLVNMRSLLPTNFCVTLLGGCGWLGGGGGVGGGGWGGGVLVVVGGTENKKNTHPKVSERARIRKVM